MKAKTPIYLLFASLLCGYLVVASRNGYSLLNTLTPPAFRSSGVNLQHK